ncbi:MAG TPA: hypothetical protein DCL66_07730 [Gammaproteobacteria bacterium]|nr:hypothetical protein [Gammaproteobacteria bacterium]
MKPFPLRSLKLLTGIFFAVSFCYFQDTPALAQSIGDDIPRIDHSPKIDGILSVGEWDNATVINVNIETEPGYNTVAEVSTKAFLMEDGDVLYVAFVAEDDDIDQVRAFFRDRDGIWRDDRVGVVLDTFNDERRAYEFFVNPFGVQADRIYDDVNRNRDDSWNAIWQSAGKLNDKGYIVEMAIPFKQLRFSPNQERQTWGIDLVRNYPRDRSNRIANNPQDRDISCYLCQIGKLRGMSNLKTSRNLEVIPTLTSTAIQTRDPAAGNWNSQAVDPDAGVDVRWGITQDIYLNATLNPDFSQVEADRAQLDINNTFSLFFPERRTFFLDGADYFDTFEDLVYTRNIANPDYGIKLTGKTGRHTYGLLTANDESTSFLIPRALSSSVASLGEFESDVAIGRYRMDIFDNSTIGAVFTNRSGAGYDNTVMSIDSVLRPTEKDTLSLQATHTTSDYPHQIQTDFDQRSNLSDDSLRLEYRHNDERWDWRVGYTDVGKDFRADLGFINRADYKFFVSTLGYTWRADGDSFFTRIRVALDYDVTEDQSGLKLEEETEMFINLDGPLQSFFNGLFGKSKTYWNGQYFDEQFNQVVIGFAPTPSLRISTQIRYEDVVDFANTRLGHSKRYRPSIDYQLGQHVEFSLSHTLQKFDVAGGRLFTANLSNLRTTYQFNAKSFLRFTLQNSYNKRDQGLYNNKVQSRSKSLTTQLLYSFRFTAATRFFIGYSDAAFQDDSLNSVEPINRTLFAKFSYAWQP